MKLNFEQIKTELAAGDAIILDVREGWEHSSGIIEGAELLPMSILTTEKPDLPLDKNIYIYCQGGYRSRTAEVILKDCGFENAIDLGLGIKALIKQGFKLVSSNE